MRFRMLPAAAALAAALLLAGCVPSDPIITPEPVPDSTPVFASDEEALAAATEAYGKYLAVSDEILADGGTDPQRLLTVATKELVDTQSVGYEKASNEGLHSEGNTTFDTVTLQSYDVNAVDGKGIVRLYLCVDVSNVDVLDRSGTSVVSSTRPNRTPFEVSFDQPSTPERTLIVASEEQWGGQDFCK